MIEVVCQTTRPSSEMVGVFCFRGYGEGRQTEILSGKKV
jgi:hypothetical protein